MNQPEPHGMPSKFLLSPTAQSPDSFRRTFTIWRIAAISFLCGASTLVVLGYASTKPLLDFQVYWTAPHLFLNHRDPYSFVDVFAIQKELGSKLPIPVMFLCPPWVLTLLAPLGLMHSYVLGWFVWFAILVTCVAVGSKLLMDIYFGDLDVPEISFPRGYRYVFAFTFYPTLYALKCAQLSPLVFLGVAGFLHSLSHGRKVPAALLLCMTMVKPHLVLLLWLAILLQREWVILITSVSALTLFSGIAVLWLPPAFLDYWNLMRSPYTHFIASGMLGGFRSLWNNPSNYWVQFVPTTAGILWLAFYWVRQKNWNWVDQTPILVAVSLLCTPYGFTHDQSLLMIPIICLAAMIARRFGRIPLTWVLLYSLVNFSVLGILFLSDQWAFMPAPIVIAGVLAGIGNRRGPFALATS